MAAGTLIGMLALIYWCRQDSTMYTKIQHEEASQKEEVLFDLQTSRSEIENSKEDTQFLLQEIADGYELILYNAVKQEVFSMVYPKEPWVREVSAGVLEIGISVGSPARYTFYFRKEDGKISNTFFYAKVFGGQYIAHRPMVGDQWDEPLILTDIFEEGILYQEICRDFSETADLMSAIYNVELADEDHIMLEYCEGEEYTVVKEVVKIEIGN